MLNFQNANSPQMLEILRFHDLMLRVITPISLGVLMSLGVFTINCTQLDLKESQELEAVWTVAPIAVLVAIGFPSLRLLYKRDMVDGQMTTIKALGHQWYWHYDYSDIPGFDSYLNTSDYRLLDVQNRLIRRAGWACIVLVTAADVLHSWTIPTLGVKADAVPGRVNKLSFVVCRPGLYFGQCREICGRNHRFIPIAMEGIILTLIHPWKM